MIEWSTGHESHVKTNLIQKYKTTTTTTRTTEHYLRNYIKINRLDYEQQLKLKERHLEQ